MQYTFFSHSDAGRVGKVDESPNHLWTHVAQSDLRGTALLKASGKHGSEEAAAGGQHHFVNLKKHIYLSITNNRNL